MRIVSGSSMARRVDALASQRIRTSIGRDGYALLHDADFGVQVGPLLGGSRVAGMGPASQACM